MYSVNIYVMDIECFFYFTVFICVSGYVYDEMRQGFKSCLFNLEWGDKFIIPLKVHMMTFWSVSASIVYSMTSFLCNKTAAAAVGCLSTSCSGRFLAWYQLCQLVLKCSLCVL